MHAEAGSQDANNGGSYHRRIAEANLVPSNVQGAFATAPSRETGLSGDWANKAAADVWIESV